MTTGSWLVEAGLERVLVDLLRSMPNDRTVLRALPRVAPEGTGRSREYASGPRARSWHRTADPRARHRLRHWCPDAGARARLGRADRGRRQSSAVCRRPEPRSVAPRARAPGEGPGRGHAATRLCGPLLRSDLERRSHLQRPVSRRDSATGGGCSCRADTSP